MVDKHYKHETFQCSLNAEKEGEQFVDKIIHHICPYIRIKVHDSKYYELQNYLKK